MILHNWTHDVRGAGFFDAMKGLRNSCDKSTSIEPSSFLRKSCWPRSSYIARSLTGAPCRKLEVITGGSQKTGRPVVGSVCASAVSDKVQATRKVLTVKDDRAMLGASCGGRDEVVCGTLFMFTVNPFLLVTRTMDPKNH